MNVELAGRVLAQMVQVWPHMTIGEQTVEAWSAATPDVDPGVAYGAVRRLAATEDRPPSIAKFLAVVRLLGRESAQPAIATGPIPHTTRREATDRIAALRAFWREAAIGRPDHNHKNGDHLCPRCSTSDEWMAEHAPEMQRVLRDNPIGVER